MLTYTRLDRSDLAQLIHSRLPPKLKVLALEGLTPPEPPGSDLVWPLFPRDVEFMTCLLEQKERLAPSLNYLFMYYLETMENPEELVKLARARGVRMSGLYTTDNLDLDLGWLESA